MRRALAVAAAITLALAFSCRIADEHLHVGDGGQGSDDAAVFLDADTGPCDHNAPWSSLASINLGTISSVARFSPDELTAYFGRGSGATDLLFVATRPTLSSGFGSARQLVGVNGSDGYGTPSISDDGVALVYTLGEPPVHPSGSDRDIYRALRIGSNYQFGTGQKLPFNADAAEDDFSYLAPNGDVWFASKRTGDPTVSIYRAPSVGGGAFGMVERQNNLNSTATANNYPLVSADLRHVFFQRVGQVFLASRGSAGAAFGTPAIIDEINADPACTGAICRPAWISPDGCRLYIGAGSASAVTMYVAAKPANP